MTSDWGGGYVTDIAYDYGYYREQSPMQLQLACLMSGVAWDVPAEGAHYLELGCGVGIGALIIAAAAGLSAKLERSASRKTMLSSRASRAMPRAAAMWAGLKSSAVTRQEGFAAAMISAPIPTPQPSSR